MIQKNIKGTGNYPKLHSAGSRTLQNTPTQIERERIINKRNQPRKRAPVGKIRIYEGNLPPNTPEDEEEAFGVIGRMMIPRSPKSESLSEACVPDEEKTERITRQTTRPRPIAPVKPKEPSQPSAPPPPPPPPEEPKK